MIVQPTGCQHHYILCWLPLPPQYKPSRPVTDHSNRLSFSLRRQDCDAGQTSVASSAAGEPEHMVSRLVRDSWHVACGSCFLWPFGLRRQFAGHARWTRWGHLGSGETGVCCRAFGPDTLSRTSLQPDEFVELVRRVSRTRCVPETGPGRGLRQQQRITTIRVSNLVLLTATLDQ